MNAETIPDRVWVGVVALIGINLLAWMVAGFAPALWIAMLFIGVTQLLWVVPCCVVLYVRGRRRTVKGVVIAAGVVFLLNATCAGLMMYGLAGL